MSALKLVARNAKETIPADTYVDAFVSTKSTLRALPEACACLSDYDFYCQPILLQVHIGPPSGAEGFALAVDLEVTSSLEDKSKLQNLVDKAHEVCPYSNAM